MTDKPIVLTCDCGGTYMVGRDFSGPGLWTCDKCCTSITPGTYGILKGIAEKKRLKAKEAAQRAKDNEAVLRSYKIMPRGKKK